MDHLPFWLRRLCAAPFVLLRYWWWCFTSCCQACGSHPRLPGRHICQKCSLTHLRLNTGAIRTAVRRDSQWVNR
jgi:hypothetical protein